MVFEREQHGVRPDAGMGAAVGLESAPEGRPGDDDGLPRDGGLPRELVDPRSSTLRRHSWMGRFQRYLWIGDAVAVVAAVLIAHLVSFGVEGARAVAGEISLNYWLVSVLIVVLWMVALSIADSRDMRVVGSGPDEYAKVVAATAGLFALITVVNYLLRIEVGRGYTAIALPGGLLLLLLGRYAIRRWVHRQRAHGEYQAATLVVGGRGAAEHLIRQLHRNPNEGYRVLGACVPDGPRQPGETVGGVPVLGGLDAIASIVAQTGADTVAVTASDSITPDVVRGLGWDLEPAGTQLVVAPSLMDVAGPRIHTRPVAGLPLIQVESPGYVGVRHRFKAVFDWVAAALILLLASPVMIVIALLVKLTSRGPVFFRQERIGLNGVPFRMFKFRSMEAGAEKRLSEVLGGEANVGLFYKLRDDPRVTPIGRVLRRYSLDELPQLLNVLRGEMSLVGPRPQIDREVALYDRTAHRRLLVKPGLTGLWQVSGRSELTPEDGIRMDVYYVENWTIFGDLVILAKTAKAMIVGSGAY